MSTAAWDTFIPGAQPVRTPGESKPVYTPTGTAAPAPTPTAWGNTAVTPALESLWQQAGGAYQQPTAIDSVFGAYAGQVGQPTYTQGIYGATASAYQTPTGSENLANQAGALYGGPAASEAYLGTALGQIGGANVLGAQSGRIDAGLSSVNNAQNYYNTVGSQFTGPTYTQQAAGGIADTYGQATQSADMYAALGGPGGFARPTETAMAGQELAGILGSATNLGQFSNQMGAQYLAPGVLENFASTALSRTNPYLDMVAERGRAAIDQASAARGAYGAGGTLAALGNYQAASDAEQFKYMADLQGAAQEAWRNRLAGGTDLARYTSAETLDRGKALQSLAGQVFDERNRQSLTGGQLANWASGETIERGKSLQSLAGQQDSARNEMGLAGSTIASNASREQIDKNEALTNLYNLTSANNLRGIEAGTSAARAASDSLLGRLSGLTDMTSAGTKAQLDRLSGLTDLAGQADTSSLARMLGYGTLATQADTTNLDYLNGMFNTAGQVQGAEQDRLNSMLDQLFRENALQSGLTGGFYQNGGAFSGSAAETGINAGANAAGLTGQAQNATGKTLADLLKLPFAL